MPAPMQPPAVAPHTAVRHPARNLLPAGMRQRREMVEQPFGTIKARMGATHFLMKTLPRVSGEVALHGPRPQSHSRHEHRGQQRADRSDPGLRSRTSTGQDGAPPSVSAPPVQQPQFPARRRTTIMPRNHPFSATFLYDQDPLDSSNADLLRRDFPTAPVGSPRVSIICGHSRRRPFQRGSSTQNPRGLHFAHKRVLSDVTGRCSAR
jgi:hypothetical protein